MILCRFQSLHQQLWNAIASSLRAGLGSCCFHSAAPVLAGLNFDPMDRL
jgi:hypothetical protein